MIWRSCVLTLFRRRKHGYKPTSVLRRLETALMVAMESNPALNLAPFGRWTALKRRRLALLVEAVEKGKKGLT